MNEYFVGDAEKMLSNSEDYLKRSTVLNRNAQTLATWLDELKTSEPEYGIRSILYPTTSDTLDNYKVWMRKSTPEFAPGYGCLFSVDFHDKADSQVFYDNLDVFIGPHLGAHHTLAICFNELVIGKDPKVAEYHTEYGVKLEQIRIAVGLEPEEELKKVFRDALEKVKEAKNGADKALGVPSEGAVVA
jgi:cystathionine gamma-synthase